MHSVENLETPESAKSLPQRPPTVRVEFNSSGDDLGLLFPNL
jgi:hypothetical protein